MKTIEFSSYAVYILDGINSVKLTDEYITKKLVANDLFYEHDEIIYVVNVTEECNGLFFYFMYGRPLPYSTQTLETTDGSIINTQREPTQAELNHQFFAYYKFEDQSLYLSTTKKKLVMSNFLSEQLKTEVAIKEFFVGPEEFYKQIETIDEIALVSCRSLVNLHDSIFDPEIDEFGLGNPHQYKIKCKFNRVQKTEKFLDFLKKKFAKKNLREVDKLICVGRGGDGMRKVLNLDAFMDKILVVTEDNQGMVNEKKSKRTFIDPN